ncbi:ABC transporter ATP-binding protein [Halobacillus sp. BBL2006]|uniref:ABC transporter ATP-binding protein n=1 Tax=Halobacillus sp. BBL2006 TaxID=1543706 RepID=UPI000542FFCA|nr:ABC transporter ATP-binding protein [Halobacillus sp. BBL2006]KHE72703.1 bacitracin ABC transporter ATP-binding protein [Halobacillus sp. BBL2006]
MEDIILTRNLSKKYQGFHVVHDVSLSVKKGEIYGFLGLNGAGKTTTIRMLLGMIRPNSGACFIRGRNVSADNYELWKEVGYMVETPHSYPELTVTENLEIARKLRGMNDRKAVSRVLSRLNLTLYESKKAKHLSLGNRQRLGIAKALIHDPSILILDEPANGLDPAGILEVRKMLITLSQQGITIFISSHILDEISKIASKIGIIHKGQLMRELGKEEWERERQKRVLIRTLDNDGALKKLTNKGYTASNREGEILQILGEVAAKHPEIITSYLVREGYPPSMIYVEEENLESYFLRIINGGGK